MTAKPSRRHALTMLSGAALAQITPGRAAAQPAQPIAESPMRGKVRTGAEVLASRSFADVAGRRVGLITNHTGRVGGRHLADVLHAAEGVRLAAIFAPEHGFRGAAEAGVAVKGSVDPATGVQVHSLYGRTRMPSRAMLRGIDLLVFDIQDVGVRFYTYISTMGLAMQAAAAAGLPFVVLDRPNPLGGVGVAGFVMDKALTSFVGQYAIPTVHGLTTAELAVMIKGARLLPGLDGLELRVMMMEGWRRSMLWPQTGLDWVAPSPNIVSFETALIYAGVGLFEATSASDGRGTRTPFALLGAPWVDGEALAEDLNRRRLAGVRFAPATFTPRAIKGMATRPRHEGRSVNGVRIAIEDAGVYTPVAAGVHILHAFQRQARANRKSRLISKPDFLAQLAGSRRLGAMLSEGATAEAIIGSWQRSVDAFAAGRQRYLLYKPT